MRVCVFVYGLLPGSNKDWLIEYCVWAYVALSSVLSVRYDKICLKFASQCTTSCCMQFTFAKNHWILSTHSNATSKNVSLPHFSWPTLYITHVFHAAPIRSAWRCRNVAWFESGKIVVSTQPVWWTDERTSSIVHARDLGDQQSHHHSSPKAPVADGLTNVLYSVQYILRDSGEDKICNCKAATYRPTQLPIDSEHYAVINVYRLGKSTCFFVAAVRTIDFITV